MRFLRVSEFVASRYKPRQCPACLNGMTSPKKLKPGRTEPRSTKSRGHDHPVSRGGSWDAYVFMCKGCNADQGLRDFVQWARVLLQRGDRRAEHVTALAVLVRGWIAEHGGGLATDRLRAATGRGAEAGDVEVGGVGLPLPGGDLPPGDFCGGP